MCFLKMMILKLYNINNMFTLIRKYLKYISNFQINEDVKFEICNNFCHALWQEDKTANGTEIIILSQGIYYVGVHYA